MLESYLIIAKNINMDRDYVNVLNTKNVDLLSICRDNNHLVAEQRNYSFLNYNSNQISVGIPYSTAIQGNYIAFQNKHYSNKWFFAWIDSIEYVSEKTTLINYTIDAWSTFYSDITVKTSFVLREHVNDDTTGIHTIPENLDIGEVIQESVTEDVGYSGEYDFYIAISCNWLIKDGSTGDEILESNKGKQYSGITVYNRNVFGSKLILFKITNLSSFTNVALYLLRANSDGHIADVENMFIIGSNFIDSEYLVSHTASDGVTNFTFYTLNNNVSTHKFNTIIEKRTTFSDFTPKNNKCFCYPYNYIFASNNNGSNNIYKYENFSTEDCVFENQLSISVGGSGRIVPKNYKGMSENDDESLALGKYPTCSWSSDAFINWLTQNSVNMAVNLGLSAGGISSGIMNSKNENIGSSSVLSVAGEIGGQIGNFYSADLLPNISGGQATGDIVWANKRNLFSFREMRVKTEYLKRIDDYFTRFGYKIDRLKIPNTTGRRNWNYVEIGSSEDFGNGNVPHEFMKKINQAVRKGVTIWHNHSNMGNFSLDNSII